MVLIALAAGAGAGLVVAAVALVAAREDTIAWRIDRPASKLRCAVSAACEGEQHYADDNYNREWRHIYIRR